MKALLIALCLIALWPQKAEPAVFVRAPGVNVAVGGFFAPRFVRPVGFIAPRAFVPVQRNFVSAYNYPFRRDFVPAPVFVPQRQFYYQPPVQQVLFAPAPLYGSFQALQGACGY